MVRDSMRARTLRNASHAEQSAPPDGTIIELRPRGLWHHLAIQAPRYANMPAAYLMPPTQLACCLVPDLYVAMAMYRLGQSTDLLGALWCAEHVQHGCCGELA